MAVLRAAGARAELPGASSRRGDVQHRPAGPDLAGGRLAVSAPLSHGRARPDHRGGIRRGGRRGAVLPARRGPLRVPRAARGSRAHARLRQGSRRDHRDLRRKAGDQPRRARDARAGRRGRDRVPELRRHAGLAAADGRTRDRRARGPGRLRRGRARAAARPPRGEAGGAPDRVPEPHGARPLRGAPGTAGGACSRAQLLRARGSRLRRRELRRQARPAAARARPRARDLRELAVEAGGGWPASRAGSPRAARCGSGSRLSSSRPTSTAPH